jgi:hypothetical protein
MADPQAVTRAAARRLAAALAAGALLALGCAGLAGSVRKSLREPGEHFEAFPEEVWRQYECEGRKLPFFKIERIELVPRKLRAGDEFNHRIVYALCPERSSEVLTGLLHTRILFRGQPVVSEREPAWEFKPGRWIVDAFVSVPENAEAGIYSMELAFESPTLSFEESRTFLVEEPKRR